MPCLSCESRRARPEVACGACVSPSAKSTTRSSRSWASDGSGPTSPPSSACSRAARTSARRPGPSPIARQAAARDPQPHPPRGRDHRSMNGRGTARWLVVGQPRILGKLGLPGCSCQSSLIVCTDPKWPGVPGDTSATHRSPSAPRCRSSEAQSGSRALRWRLRAASRRSRRNASGMAGVRPDINARSRFQTSMPRVYALSPRRPQPPARSGMRHRCRGPGNSLEDSCRDIAGGSPRRSRTGRPARSP